QPARPLTGSVCGQPTEKKKEDQEQQRFAALVGSARMKKAAEGPLLLLLAPALLSSLAWVDATEICQRPEGWGRAGYPRHGWRG
ncbi:TPA: hypothetical protein ACG4NN_004421, partial [Stenotrophomonas maltophilia]